MNRIRAYFRRQGLVRRTDERVLGGVCAGLARRFGISPLTARVLFVLTLVLIPGSQILVYPLLWLLLPADAHTPASFGAPSYHS